MSAYPDSFDTDKELVAELIPDLEHQITEIHKIGTMGCLMAFNISLGSPQARIITYPMDWQIEYAEGGHQFGDPIVIWPFIKTGYKRWSEVALPDPTGVFLAARRHNIRYGAVFSTKVKSYKSILSVARDDRELTNEELVSLDERWKEMTSRTVPNAGLSDNEILALKHLYAGLPHDRIASELGKSVPSVRRYLERAKRALSTDNPYRAAIIAKQRNFF